MNKDTLMLILLVLEILFLSFVNSIVLLSLYLVLIIMLFLLKGGKGSALILTVKRVITFSIVLSFAFYLHSVFSDRNPYQYISLFNLRLFDTVFSVMYFREFANPVRAFSFSKTLSYMFSLTYSQIRVFIKLYNDFELVKKSRMINRGTYKKRLFFLMKMIGYFFIKAIKRSEDVAIAMKSRGFFLYD